MIPKFLTLSEEEKRVLDLHTFELSKRVDDFSSRLLEWMRQNEKFLEIIKNYPLEYIENIVNSVYIRMISSDDKREKSLEKLNELQVKLGISLDDLIAVYNMYYDHIQSSVESLDIDPLDKVILKSAIRKRVEREMFVHLNGVQDFQQKRLEEGERFYKVLAEIGKIGIGYHEMTGLEELLSQIATAIAEDLNLALVWIGTARPKDKWIKIVAVAGKASEYTRDLKIPIDTMPDGRGLTGISMSRGKFFITDNFDESFFKPQKERADKFNLGSSATVSFKTSDDNFWNISMYNEKGRKFPDQIEDLLTNLSKELEILVENFNRSSELSKIRNYEKGLMEIQKLLTTNLPPDMVYSKAVKVLTECMRKLGTVKIVVPSLESEWMITVSSAGEDSKLFLDPNNSQMISTDPNRYPEGQIVTSKCFREGKSFIVHPEEDPVYIAYWGKYPDLIRLSVIASWPILDRNTGEPIAVLTMGSYDPDYFTKDLMMLIEQITSNIGMAIERYKKEEKIEWMGLHDILTGLPNRLYFYQSARNAMKYANRGHMKIAIGFMDIDDFKSWNDTFGHNAGDELLKKIGTKIGSIIRGGDVIARIGGDEFLFHLLLNNYEELKVVTKRIKDTLSSIDERMKLSCSIGWAVYPDDAQDLDDLINLASKDLWIQKEKRKK